MHWRSDAHAVWQRDAPQTCVVAQSAEVTHPTQRPAVLSQTRAGPQASEFVHGVNGTQRPSVQSLFALQSATVTHSTQYP